MVERIAQRGEIERGGAGCRQGLVPLGGRKLHDPVLHCKNGVAAGDFPLAVGAVTGKAVADLDGPENAAGRAQHDAGVILDRVRMRAGAERSAGHLRFLAGQMEEHVEAVRAEVAQAAAAGLGGIENPGAVPGRVAPRPRPVDAHIDVRQRPQAPSREQLAGARGERRIALRQRDGDECAEPGCLGGHRLHLGRVDPHRLLHQEGIAEIEQVMGDGGHLPVPPERHDEVGTLLREHLLVIGEGRRVADFGRASRDNAGVGVLDGDELHVRHGDEVAQIGGVVERMPMADLDGGDANGHGCPLYVVVASVP